MASGMQERIREKLAQALQPILLSVENQSALHAGHAGDDGSGESHFAVVIVSKAFEGKGRVERQRMIHDLLAYELSHGIHALSIKALEPDEYDRVNIHL